MVNLRKILTFINSLAYSSGIPSFDIHPYWNLGTARDYSASPRKFLHSQSSVVFILPTGEFYMADPNLFIFYVQWSSCNKPCTGFMLVVFYACLGEECHLYCQKKIFYQQVPSIFICKKKIYSRDINNCLWSIAIITHQPTNPTSFNIKTKHIYLQCTKTLPHNVNPLY